MNIVYLVWIKSPPYFAFFAKYGGLCFCYRLKIPKRKDLIAVGLGVSFISYFLYGNQTRISPSSRLAQAK